MAEVNTEDEPSRVQIPELLPEMSEPDHTTNSQCESKSLKPCRDSVVLTKIPTLLSTRWWGIEYWSGMILRFVLYSPLRNFLSQAIDFFWPKTGRNSDIAPSGESLPVDPYASGTKFAPDGKAYFVCDQCGGWRRAMHPCSRHCVPSSTFRPQHSPRANSHLDQCPVCGRYLIKGKRCLDGLQF